MDSLVRRNVGTDPETIRAFIKEALDAGYGAVALAPDAAAALIVEKGAPSFTTILVYRETCLEPGVALAIPRGTADAFR